MNGLSVLLILALGCAIVFVAIVKFDRWLDDRETNALIESERRRREARERLAAMYRENPDRIRLGHHEGGDR